MRCWLISFLAMWVMVLPASADEVPAPWRINNIPLDMPLDAEMNGEFLEGIYQEKLGDRLIESVLNEWPSYYIQSTLKAGESGQERMELYFSSEADQRRVFWIRTHKQVEGAGDPAAIAETLKVIETGFAKADRIITDGNAPGGAILVIVDTSLPPAEQDRLRAALADPLQLSADDFSNFWHMDLQSRAKILGPNFRGGIAILNAFQGRLHSMQLELLDLNRAQTVFRLTP